MIDLTAFLASPAWTDPRFYHLMLHLSTGMLGLLPWPVTSRRWRNRLLVVWLVSGLALGAWLLGLNLPPREIGAMSSPM